MVLRPRDPDIAALLREGFRWLRDFLVGEINRAGLPNADHEAAVLLALHDGLIGHVLAGHHTPESAQAVLNTHLTHIFAP